MVGGLFFLLLFCFCFGIVFVVLSSINLNNGCVTGHAIWLYRWSCADLFMLFLIPSQMLNGHFLQPWPHIVVIFLRPIVNEVCTGSHVGTKTPEFCFLLPVPTMGHCTTSQIVAHSTCTFLSTLPYVLVPNLFSCWPDLSQYVAMLMNGLSTQPKHYESRILP